MIDYDKLIRDKCEDLPTLTYDHCITVMQLARALTVDEAYDFLMLPKKELTPEEQNFIELLYRRGKTVGIKDACDNLFLQMRMRGGGQTSLDYLRAQSGQFTATITPSAKGTFQFNVVIPNEDDIK